MHTRVGSVMYSLVLNTVTVGCLSGEMTASLLLLRIWRGEGPSLLPQ